MCTSDGLVSVQAGSGHMSEPKAPPLARWASMPSGVNALPPWIQRPATALDLQAHWPAQVQHAAQQCEGQMLCTDVGPEASRQTAVPHCQTSSGQGQTTQRQTLMQRCKQPDTASGVASVDGDPQCNVQCSWFRGWPSGFADMQRAKYAATCVDSPLANADMWSTGQMLAPCLQVLSHAKCRHTTLQGVQGCMAAL